MEDMDERLKKEIDVERDDPRTTRAASAGRRSRDADDREVTGDRELSDDDRLEMFRQTLFNDVLPDLPKINGYHVCWLSTNHPSDTIARRMQLGYSLVRPEEVPGMVHATLKTGEYEGGIGVNEMVAFKLPQSLYLSYMNEAHHDAPNRQVAGVLAQVDTLKAQAERDEGKIVEGEGIQEMRRGPSRGKFDA